jgi:hypothetical protein
MLACTAGGLVERIRMYADVGECAAQMCDFGIKTSVCERPCKRSQPSHARCLDGGEPLRIRATWWRRWAVFHQRDPTRHSSCPCWRRGRNRCERLRLRAHSLEGSRGSLLVQQRGAPLVRVAVNSTFQGLQVAVSARAIAHAVVAVGMHAEARSRVMIANVAIISGA